MTDRPITSAELAALQNRPILGRNEGEERISGKSSTVLGKKWVFLVMSNILMQILLCVLLIKTELLELSNKKKQLVCSVLLGDNSYLFFIFVCGNECTNLVSFLIGISYVFPFLLRSICALVLLSTDASTGNIEIHIFSES